MRAQKTHTFGLNFVAPLLKQTYFHVSQTSRMDLGQKTSLRKRHGFVCVFLIENTSEGLSASILYCNSDRPISLPAELQTMPLAMHAKKSAK